MDLSIIIVNWNSKDFLRECIASILPWSGDISLEIVVIDSGSFDGCGAVLEKYGPKVRFIQSETNLGFARANNEAYKVSQGQSLLFLNPDTRVLGSAIETMHRYLCSLPSAGVIGAKLLNGDDSVQTTCVRSFPTVLNQFLESALLRRWFPRSALWGMLPLFQNSETPSEVDAVSGACLMMSRAAFESVGMFSSDYFMYSEDIDICYKARIAGRKTYYVPTAVVVHYGGESTSKSSESAFSSVMMLESRWRFFRKTRPAWYSFLYRAAMFVASVCRIGAVATAWPLGAMRGRTTALRAALRKWTARLRWTVGGERWVKTYPRPVE